MRSQANNINKTTNDSLFYTLSASCFFHLIIYLGYYFTSIHNAISHLSAQPSLVWIFPVGLALPTLIETERVFNLLQCR